MGQNGLIMVDILFKNPGMKWKIYCIRYFFFGGAEEAGVMNYCCFSFELMVKIIFYFV